MIEGKVLYSFRKSSTETVKVRTMIYSGKNVVDIRVFNESLNGEFVPTKKGIMLDARNFSELEKSIDLLRRELDANKKANIEELSSVRESRI